MITNIWLSCRKTIYRPSEELNIEWAQGPKSLHNLILNRGIQTEVPMNNFPSMEMVILAITAALAIVFGWKYYLSDY